MTDSPRASVVGILTAPLGAPASPAEVSLAIWRQQLDVAEASERVNERQVRLLLAQRDVIDDQLAEVTRKRDDATRLVLDAQKAIADLTGPLAVEKLDPTDPEHRARTWRGQGGEIWRYRDDDYLKVGDGLGAFLWTRNHPAALPAAPGRSVGGPFTEVQA
ncbi:hypothetical protein SEA_AMGINE_61 [Mycobacterium phage Amgine]|uniref:Uncharacterized protein n=1 Tax=Mycobacterium phage Amgine TaxID=2015817 RepID=A0A222ZMZ3_9CAUD|nr:hypothetical protein I5G84_gp61 [Mycobacterium phage Amgine]ASR85662.1 hypothetical protein SEA_AMGINE_61 [Mycobacterium phage Amgine]